MAALVLVVAAASASTAQVRVVAEWDANVDGVTAGYRVFVGRASGSYEADIDAGPQTSLPLDLPLGQVYYVIVRAYNAARLMGPPSAEAVVDLGSAPGAPAGFRSSVNGSLATLQWGPPSSGGSPTQYLLSVGTAPGGADLLNDYPVGAVYSVSGTLSPGRYYARLRASNLFGVGPFAPEVSFQVGGSFGPLNPVNLSVAWQGTIAVLSWSPPQTNRPEEMPTAYVIEAGQSSGTADIATINVGNTTSYATDVAPGTYFVRVKGVNAYGVSVPSNEIVVQGRGAPGRPTALASSGSGSTVVLRWNAPVSGGPFTGYVIEAGSAPGLSDLAVLTIGSQTTFQTDAPPGTYYVRVRAMNARGTGDPSNEIIVRR